MKQNFKNYVESLINGDGWLYSPSVSKMMKEIELFNEGKETLYKQAQRLEAEWLENIREFYQAKGCDTSGIDKNSLKEMLGFKKLIPKDALYVSLS